MNRRITHIVFPAVWEVTNRGKFTTDKNSQLTKEKLMLSTRYKSKYMGVNV